MRCDLHVHTVHSGLCNLPVLSNFCNESYSEPHAVYEKLKRQGLDLITITDHDCIDVVESLRCYPDFFVSEEVTCTTPSGSKMHVGVYDLNDWQHMQIQQRRDDFESLVAYLREQNLFFSVNHIFSSLTGRRTADDFGCFEEEFDAFEILNGCMLETANRNAALFAARSGKIGLGGSDAHTLASVGSCWTEVSGARNKTEFIAGLRQGRGTVHGTSGSYYRLTRDILHIGVSMFQATPWTLPIVVIAGLAPVITAANYVMEKRFSAFWGKHLETNRGTLSPVRESAERTEAAEEVAA